MSKPRKKMGRPPKDEGQKMRIPVRIMVTAEQKQLLDEAAAFQGGELSAWARLVLLNAARELLAKK
jgi:uncharacterized protein (DUF1778 family)